MIVVVDERSVRLEDPEDFRRFDVVLRTDEATAASQLTLARAGRLTGDGHAAISVPWLRFAAASVSETDAWREGFAAMLGYAATKSWLTDDGAILGHLVSEPRGTRALRTAIVGLGAQGSGVARLLSGLGHEVVAAVDIGDRVGRRIADLVPGFSGEGVVLDSIATLLDEEPELDVVALTASVHLATTIEWAGALVDRGIDVVTLDHESFGYAASWVPELDARAKRGGATFLSVGVQDVAWVQLISVASAAVTGLRRITLTNLVPLEVLSTGIAADFSLGSAPADVPVRTLGEEDGPIVGAALGEIARRLGLEVVSQTTTVEPVVGDSDYEWIVGGRTLPAGTVQGTRERSVVVTDRGIELEGVIAAVPGGEDISENVVEFDAEPPLRVSLGPITTAVTDIALVSRIADVVAAPAGVLFSADLVTPRTALPVVGRD